MKRQLYYLVILSLFAAPVSARSYCESLENFSTAKPFYMGLDVRYFHVKPKSAWSDIFPSNMGGMAAFFGYDFQTPFSLEVGAQWSFNRRKSRKIVSGETAFGANNTLGQVVITGRSRLATTYLDVRYRFPICDAEVFPYLGLGVIKPRIEIQTLPGGSDLDSRLQPIRGSSELLLRAGLGVQKAFAQDWGWRFMLQFENTAQAVMRGVPSNNPESSRYLYNGLSAIFGVYYKL